MRGFILTLIILATSQAWALVAPEAEDSCKKNIITRSSETKLVYELRVLRCQIDLHTKSSKEIELKSKVEKVLAVNAEDNKVNVDIALNKIEEEIQTEKVQSLKFQIAGEFLDTYTSRLSRAPIG